MPSEAWLKNGFHRQRLPPSTAQTKSRRRQTKLKKKAAKEENILNKGASGHIVSIYYVLEISMESNRRANVYPLLIILGIINAGFIGYYFAVALPNHNAELEKIERDKLQLEQQKETQAEDLQKQQAYFKNELDCRNQFDKLRMQCNNVTAVNYSDKTGSCVVKYFDKNGVTQESDIELFQ